MTKWWKEGEYSGGEYPVGVVVMVDSRIVVVPVVVVVVVVVVSVQSS